jgi:uncharacterized protein (UPF0147 family)
VFTREEEPVLRSRLSCLILLAAVGCYPEYTHVQKQTLLLDDSVPQSIRTALQQKMDTCTKNVDDARSKAHDQHAQAYYSGLAGGIATTVTGSGAGGLGAGQQQIPSGVLGGISLVVGVITVILVDKNLQKAAEDKQTKMLQAWYQIGGQVKSLETAVIKHHFDPDHNPVADIATALTAVNSSLTDCNVAGVDPQLLNM